jgi:protein transport protein SEC61 subunit beta
MTTARPPKSALKKRNSQGSSGNLTSPADGRRSGAGGSTAQMMRMYTDDAPGLKVDPITVLVFSLMFIGAVFVLHIWGKFTRG